MKESFKNLFSGFIFLMIIFCTSISLFAQTSNLPRPKLVVGIVVDQMRWDYLYRFYNRYGNGGFKRLINEGYNCDNVYIDHLPAVTAIGHSTIYTGSVPAIHGITGNNWVDQITSREWYCAEDTLVQGVGTNSSEGKMSPRNLLAPTITDELAMATNFHSKIVGLSIKDRASIMPAGHTPTAAFWLDGDTGNFISSTYYLKELPLWVQKFNSLNRGKELVKNGWNTLYPIESYTQSTPDNSSWEGLFPGEKQPAFPHDIKKFYELSPSNISKTPFGNTLLLEFAETAIDGYKLAEGPETNFLALSFSSTDYVGHQYSANSVEAEDIFLRLDKDLAKLLSYLDKKVGKGNYSVFLTADHGGSHNPEFLKEHHILTGLNIANNAAKNANAYLNQHYGLKNIVKTSGATYLSFDDKQIIDKRLDSKSIKEDVIEFLRKEDGVQFVADMNKIGNAAIPQIIKEKLINGFNSKRTGSIAFIAEPGWTYAGSIGGSHSMWGTDDTHIPLIFMGWGFNKGRSVENYSMCDIAPTIASLLHIQSPNGTIGKAIKEVIKTEP